LDLTDNPNQKVTDIQEVGFFDVDRLAIPRDFLVPGQTIHNICDSGVVVAVASIERGVILVTPLDCKYNSKIEQIEPARLDQSSRPQLS
jgi:hypothetical protein